MLRFVLAPIAIAAGLTSFAAAALGVESCELNGEHVNPNNGNTTASKTGLMRCRDGDGGPVVREQELKSGVFMGVVRHFDKDGALLREHRVNERGNRDGPAREYERPSAGAEPALVREETCRNGSSVGIVRTCYPAGPLKRVAFYGDDGRELASAEFTKDGKLYELGCGPRPLLGPDADDARWCGHAGGASEVVLYNGTGEAKAKLVYERGERRKSDFLSAGVVREQRETSDSGGVERSFYESGKFVHEKRWKTGGRGDSQPNGTHKRWDSEGRLPAESVDDERGRLTRERELDASVKVVRDDEVFEDGSRMAFGK